MSNRRRKSIGQRKLAENKMIRQIRGADHHMHAHPGCGVWRDEYQNATTMIMPDGKTAMINADGRVLTDHAKIMLQTDELRDARYKLAGKHYGWVL